VKNQNLDTYCGQVGRRGKDYETKLVSKFPPGRHGSKEKNVIKMDVQSIGSEDKDWIELDQNFCEKQDLALVASKVLCSFNPSAG
jgi:hypothetical protein